MSSTDTQIQTLLDKVAAAKADVQSTESAAEREWKTNCSFSFNWNGTDPKNIQTMTLDQVFAAAQWLKLVEQAGELVEIDVGVPIDRWQGVPIKQWLEDLQKRVARHQLAAKKAKLQSIETALNGLISPELRAKMELERITKELAGL